MKLALSICLLIFLASTACMSTVRVAQSPIPTVQEPVETVTIVETKQVIDFSRDEIPTMEACSFIAVTETNIREYKSVDSEPVGIIQAGETVQAACTVDEWARVRKGWVCIAALIGTGGCKTLSGN